MRTLETIEAEIAGLEQQTSPLLLRLEKLRRERGGVQSKNFISANSITRDDVEMSSGEGKPWFGSVWRFSEWIRRQENKKRWAEWNGRIYNTAELLDGIMPDNAPGLSDDLPK